MWLTRITAVCTVANPTALTFYHSALMDKWTPGL